MSKVTPIAKVEEDVQEALPDDTGHERHVVVHGAPSPHDAHAEDEKHIEELADAAAKRKLRTPSAVRRPLSAWRAKRWRDVKNDDFYERVMPILLSKAVELRRSFNQRKGSMSGMVWVKNVILLMLENAYDLYLCVHYWAFGYYQYSVCLGGILAFSAVVQAVSAWYYTREGPGATLAALFGLKVFVEVQRAVKDTPPGQYLR